MSTSALLLTSRKSWPGMIETLFGNKIISRRDEFLWPVRSPYLSFLGYFLYGLIKQKLFKSNPIGALKQLIQEVIALIDQKT